LLFENGPGTNGQIWKFSFFIFFDSKLAGAGQFTGKLVPDFGHQKQKQHTAHNDTTTSTTTTTTTTTTGHQKQKQHEAHNDNCHPQRCEENHFSSIANEI
jgi:hypothetical protein